MGVAKSHVSYAFERKHTDMKTIRNDVCPSRGNETFILIHGAWHGGWCWENIERRLHALGHKTIAPDMPGHGLRKEKIENQTLQNYVDCVVKILDEQEEPVILVGHSLGGAIVTMAAEARPEKIRKIIYLAAFMMAPGQSCNGMKSGIKPMDLLARSENGLTVPWGLEQVNNRFAQDCSNVDRQYMISKLNEEAIEPLIAEVFPTEKRWGSIRRFYIACLHDKAVSPDVVKEMLQTSPCEEVYELLADHSAFYSAPEELCYVLHKIALKG